MATGEPGLPMRFRWRDSEYEVERIIDTWKTTGPCRNGGSEQYVRKHWFRVETTDGAEMQIYFDRQPRSRQNKKRWWLATVLEKKNDG
jgi:phosphoribosylglycinamide formyltransferase-1